MTIESIMRMGPVIPVVIIEDIEHAVPLPTLWLKAASMLLRSHYAEP